MVPLVAEVGRSHLPQQGLPLHVVSRYYAQLADMKSNVLVAQPPSWLTLRHSTEKEPLSRSQLQRLMTKVATAIFTPQRHK